MKNDNSPFTISIGAHAFVIELGTGCDGMDSFSAVFMLEEWGFDPESVLLETSKQNLVMSLQEQDGQEIIFLTVSGLNYVFGISEKIRSHRWFSKN